MFWQLWSLVLSHGLAPNGLPWSPGWHVCSTCLQLCLSLCKPGIKCKSAQARMTGEKGDVFPGSQRRFLFLYPDDGVRVAWLYCVSHMCITTLFFPCKKNGAQLKSTFSLLDLPSRSHFWYLATSTSQGPWEGEHQGQKLSYGSEKRIFPFSGKEEEGRWLINRSCKLP